MIFKENINLHVLVSIDPTVDQLLWRCPLCRLEIIKCMALWGEPEQKVHVQIVKLDNLGITDVPKMQLLLHAVIH